MAEPVKVKGTAVAATVRYILERFGPTKLDAVLADFPAPLQAELKRGALSSKWYEFSMLASLMRRAKAQCAPNDHLLYRNIGRASTDYAMSMVLKVFFKVATPEFAASQAVALFSSFWSSGKLTVVSSSKGAFSFKVEEFREPCPEFCERVLGWAERMLELAGGKNTRMNHTDCTCKGQSACLFVATWN